MADEKYQYPPKKIVIEYLQDMEFRLDKLDVQINLMMNDMSDNIAKLLQRHDEAKPTEQISHMEDRLSRLERKLQTYWSGLNRDFNNLLERGRDADRQKDVLQATVDRTSTALRDDDGE